MQKAIDETQHDVTGTVASEVTKKCIVAGAPHRSLSAPISPLRGRQVYNQQDAEGFIRLTPAPKLRAWRDSATVR